MAKVKAELARGAGVNKPPLLLCPLSAPPTSSSSSPLLLCPSQTLTYPSGAKYVGTLKDGKREGQGTYTYASGNKYVGMWKDDKMEGQGTYTRADGSVLHRGLWKNDKPVT